ncbi:Glycine betaine/carnitine/choline transport ATP-binding protein OpuCA [Aquisphaera giovannonii]|uniref:Glycine betaine/carnitine/choline transport ATP-binding protein OpuCA n=1 Tax=Aquisphaera giovannonii TaxID=406548 RepID=A0A5B9W098_9BACT|nr:ATP-binding cassette domain-containing protein [Aquisphaera giovannonii]QEH33669.1 Glycine betaine/carnitine/choline transport ATP-binding protein OpuCA [Aquisphaera giovannonii]
MPDATPSIAAASWAGVSKTYPDGRKALNDVHLNVHKGEILALLGTSGSGKTTLLKMLNALVLPSSGEVRVRGKATTEWSATELRRSIGFVIQEGGLMPHLTVHRNVSLAARIQGKPRAEREELAASRLRLVGLDPDRFGGRFPRELSGGQRQRVGVARALAASSDLILMDEPFGALDPVTRRDIQDEFRDLQRKLGTTVVIVTHDIREACRLGDRLALLHEGTLLQVGRAAEFLDHPATDYVRRFFLDAAAVDLAGEAS